MEYIALWFLLGLIGVILFTIAELSEGKFDNITLSSLIRIICVILSGPLGIVLFIYVWGDDIVLWKRK